MHRCSSQRRTAERNSRPPCPICLPSAIQLVVVVLFRAFQTMSDVILQLVCSLSASFCLRSISQLAIALSRTNRTTEQVERRSSEITNSDNDRANTSASGRLSGRKRLASVVGSGRRCNRRCIGCLLSLFPSLCHFRDGSIFLLAQLGPIHTIPSPCPGHRDDAERSHQLADGNGADSVGQQGTLGEKNTEQAGRSREKQ